MIKSGDLINRRHRQIHRLGQRRQIVKRQSATGILNAVQISIKNALSNGESPKISFTTSRAAGWTTLPLGFKLAANRLNRIGFCSAIFPPSASANYTELCKTAFGNGINTTEG